MSASRKAIDLLKAIEERATKPYDDQTGKDISSWVKGATIGYGHLIIKNDWGLYKNGITKAEALALFRKDLSPYENKVKNSVTANITQNEFDAMLILILTFNIGKAGFAGSSILKLVNRRKAEWNIYSRNVYKKW
ncbi:MAG TPA: hypothetical protein ENI64_04020 [Gammaproteobacteria bacterium]|nr:hypothetical protein [Gammaproteobacteria bacterium]